MNKSKTSIRATRNILWNIRKHCLDIWANYEKEIRQYVKENDCNSCISARKYNEYNEHVVDDAIAMASLRRDENGTVII